MLSLFDFLELIVIPTDRERSPEIVGNCYSSPKLVEISHYAATTLKCNTKSAPFEMTIQEASIGEISRNW